MNKRYLKVVCAFASITILVLFILVACTSTEPELQPINPGLEYIPYTPTSTPTPHYESTPQAQPQHQAITEDREGNPITLPANINRIISIGPSNTEILSALGLLDMVIATDDHSINLPNINSGIPAFDMMSLDGEQIINLEPDVIFITGMSRGGGGNPLQLVSDVGICVIFIPISSSIAGIKEDIRFISTVMDVLPQGEEIIAEMEREIETFRAIGITIPEEERKTVYVEVYPAPWLVSFGTGVFMHELLEIIGASNMLGDLEGWTVVSDETVLDLNPCVILTTVDFLDDPIGEIASRPGWNQIPAVQNGNVFVIDANASSRPSQNIIIALREMATAIYPEFFE